MKDLRIKIKGMSDTQEIVDPYIDCAADGDHSLSKDGASSWPGK